MKKLFRLKHIFLFSNLAVVLFIISGFVCVVYKDTRSYQDLAEQHLKNIVTLADLNIEKFIENTMSRPVTVSKTMANDSFLKSWMQQESGHTDKAYFEKLYNYLDAYREKYGYSTVFCISEATGRYYYQDGLNKTISRTDPHDIWYYSFIKSGQEYDLEVDTSEENNDRITIFVNFRVENADGRLLGVIGVGLQVNFLENLIRFYEDDYGLSIYIINSSNVQTSFTGKTDNFIGGEELQKLVGNTNPIQLDKSEKARVQWFTVDGSLKCLITSYNKTLGWYLIVEKDTATISNTFRERIRKNILFMLITLAACITVITFIFINYNQMIVISENKDEVTGLPNRKLFLKLLPPFIRKQKKQPLSLFMFDIDNFKTINDTYGHMFGNEILKMTGKALTSIMEDDGLAARWGGDEFIGVMALDCREAEKRLGRLQNELNSRTDDKRRNITFSAGLVPVNRKQGIDQTVGEADAALYCSKQNGRCRTTVYTPDAETGSQP
ncbi:MAG: sensor domain-containing diguanylate cyclase [Treponema sp.]|jgi:diguanylate cyclase (GGDEF)-like protein|nr:sensor domain-containing diguanylate cyclase [Treponema sp.]